MKMPKMTQSNQNGKGDRPRNNISKQYRDNYDDIFRKKKVKLKTKK